VPREIYLLSADPITVAQVAVAGVEIDPDLVLRGIANGNATQLLDAEDEAVLTIENSRKLADPADALTLLPQQPRRLGALEPGECWWTQAVAPWSRRGTIGTRITTRLAELLNARLWIEDGQ